MESKYFYPGRFEFYNLHCVPWRQILDGFSENMCPVSYIPPPWDTVHVNNQVSKAKLPLPFKRFLHPSLPESPSKLRFKEALSVQVFVNGGTTTIAKTHETTTTKQSMEEKNHNNDDDDATANIATTVSVGVPDLLRNVGEFPETFLWELFCVTKCLSIYETILSRYWW